MAWLESLILGAVQGVTEFLPVSSDGHLKITQEAFAYLTGTPRSVDDDLFFDVMLHVGTLTAILIYYRAVGLTAWKGLRDIDDVPSPYKRPAVIRTCLLAAVATTPLIPLALFFMKWIKKAFEGTTATGIGFLITAAALLVTTWLQRRDEAGKGPRETSYLDAFLIGLAQMFAPLPGVSRSGLTVAAALALGLNRSWAVGFSLLIAVPAILGAALKELKDVNPATLTGDRVSQTLAATILAGLVGFAAIIWLIKVVRSGKLWYFSVYLAVLGLAVLGISAVRPEPTSNTPGVSPHARLEDAGNRTIRGGRSRPDLEQGTPRSDRPLARADTSGASPGS